MKPYEKAIQAVFEETLKLINNVHSVMFRALLTTKHQEVFNLHNDTINSDVLEWDDETVRLAYQPRHQLEYTIFSFPTKGS